MKKSFKNRIFFIKALGGLALLLIAALSAISYHNKSMIDARNMRVTQDSIEVKFVNTITGLGIKPEWIRKKAIRTKNTSQPDSLFQVIVPSDLPIGVILVELNKQFVPDTIKLNSTEKEIKGSTDLVITADKKTKLIANFIYNKSNARTTARAAFVLSGIEKEKQKEQERIIQLPEELSFMILPVKANVDLVKTFKQNHKDYVVLINDDIKEPNFKISPRFTKGRIINAIKDIVASFKDAKYCVVDNNSGLADPEIYKLISSEFLKRNIKVILSGSFKMIEGKNDDDLLNKFNTELNSIRPEKIELFIMNIDDFNTVADSFQAMRKKGLKYVSITESDIDDR